MYRTEVLSKKFLLKDCNLNKLKSRWEYDWSKLPRPIFYEDIKKESEQFFKCYKSFSVEGRVDKFLKSDFAKFTVNAFPTASREVMRILSDFYYFLFVFDDLIDYTDECGNDFNKSLQLVNGVDSVFGYGYTPYEKDIFTMFFDIWERIKKITTPLQQHNIAFYLKEYFDGTLEQVHVCLNIEGNDEYNPKSGKEWNFEKFKIHKRKVSGTKCCFWFCELVLSTSLPVDFIEHPLCKKLLDSFCDVIWMCNDIYSTFKEIEGGIEHHDNFITVLHQLNPTLSGQQIIDLACKMHEDEEINFEKLEEEAKIIWKNHEEILSFISITKHFNPGSLEWQNGNPRYEAETYADF